MSILIKGMDMPKNGEIHHITIYDNGNTYITTSNMLCETDRKDVEAIQIPTPHGRLIDGDLLRANWIFQLGSTFEKLANAPTIIEAEEV